jgi:superfamily I DNA and/or RNA helicase
MLQTQFRMHPAIRLFPSRHFYEGKPRILEPYPYP